MNALVHSWGKRNTTNWQEEFEDHKADKNCKGNELG